MKVPALIVETHSICLILRQSLDPWFRLRHFARFPHFRGFFRS